MEQIVQQLEGLRKAAMQYVLIAIAIALLGFILFLVAHPMIGIFTVVIAFLFYLAAARKKQQDYALAYKEKIVKAALAGKFDDLYFSPSEGISKDTLEATGMIHLGNRYSCNDYIRGRYKGIPFEQSDVCIQNVTNNGKTTTTETYFEGRWMIFAFNKNFLCDLQVRERGFSAAKKSRGWFSDKPSMERLKLEDEQFNREFNVYAVDPHEAYYILTPHMMQSMRTLRDQTHGELLLCFINNRLHVAVDSRTDAFEPPLFSPITQAHIANTVTDEIDVITRFVDELNLDQTIYKTY